MFEFMLGVGAGLLTGWMFLPEPKFVRNFFVRMGLAKPTDATRDET
jgi:hypothetical protein